MEAIKIEILKEHLPYELDMLDAATEYMQSPEFAAAKRTNNRTIWFCRNAAIEAFWTHARNIVEFLTRPKSADLTISSASPKDFAASFYSKLSTADALITRINEQVTHLGFKRKAAADSKLGSIDINWLKPAIDSDIKQLEEKLDEECRPYWTHRSPVKFVFVNATHTTSSAAGYTVLSTPTGPAFHRPKD